MRVCTRCVLPERFPGIRFDKEGVCQFCRRFRPERTDEARERYRLRFEALLESRSHTGGHDAIMAYSGGKDSTYALMLLRRDYGLSVLSVTLDNGFISPVAMENIRAVVEHVGCDHIFFKPRFDVLRRVFRRAIDEPLFPVKTLERASTICTACMAVARFTMLRLAVERRIPFIVYGWSPGQVPIEASVMKNNPAMSRSMQKAVLEPLRRAGGPEIDLCFMTEDHFAGAPSFPYSISPLAFLAYDEERLIAEIESIGWRKPADTWPHSTNCLLNGFASEVHQARFGFHPYAFELAKLVREGCMPRAEALARLETREDPEVVALVRRRLAGEGERLDWPDSEPGGGR